MKKLISAIICISLFAGCKKDTKDEMPTSLKNGLVGYWPFNGNANDESGNGNNGVANGATLTSDRFGNTKKAFSFNGSTDYISVNNASTLNPVSISIACWVYSNANSTNVEEGAKAIVTKWNQVIDCGNDGANFTTQLSFYNNTNVLACGTIRNDKISNSLKTNNDLIGLNKWKHFVFIHDAIKGQKLYIDGVLVNDNNVLGDLCQTSNKLYFGTESNNNLLWRFFNGKLDDIRIYNRALTQTEITYLAKN